MRAIDQNVMNRLFEVVDELGLSREAVEVPLLMIGDGEIRPLGPGRGLSQRFEIELPDTDDLTPFLTDLPRALRRAGWSGDREV